MRLPPDEPGCAEPAGAWDVIGSFRGAAAAGAAEVAEAAGAEEEGASNVRSAGG